MSAVSLAEVRASRFPARPAIQMKQVKAGYDGTVILRSIDLTVSEGEFVGLVGPNGIGKTTLFRVIMGLLVPDSGTVEVLGRPLVDEASRRWVRQQTGYLAQQNDPGRMPITVLDAVLLGRWGSYQYRYWPGPKDRAQAEAMLELVGMLQYRRADWRELSGGQQQRVSLARALVRSPRLLILDEPTTYLDEAAQRELMDLVLQVHRSQGLTTLMVSHDRRLMSNADVIYRLTGQSLERVVK